jgi:hypothetical protein
VGTFADVVVADAIVKGVGGFDIVTAIDALSKDAFTPPPQYSGGSVGKAGLAEYTEKGYLAMGRDAGGGEVSRLYSQL